MAIVIGMIASELTCDADEGRCMNRFAWPSADPVEVRARAIGHHGWVKVKPVTGPVLDFCARHAFGSKKGPGSSSQLRIFQPPPS